MRNHFQNLRICTSLWLAASASFVVPQSAWAGTPPGCWAQVNGATNTTTSAHNVTPYSVTLSNALTNPSIIVVAITNVGSTVLNTPSDTAGNTYIDYTGSATNAGKINTGSGNAWSMNLYYALNTSTVSNTITETAPGSGGQISINAEEWTGGVTSSPLDQKTVVSNVSIGGATGQNISMGFTTTQGGELIFALIQPENGQPIQGPSWPGPQWCAFPSGESCSTDGYQFIATAVQRAKGAFAGTWSDSDTSDVYSGIMMSLKGKVCNPPHAGIM